MRMNRQARKIGKMTWTLREARNKLSEVIRHAQTSGPQFITVHGEDTVVVLSAEDYQKLTKTKGSLTDFFRECPWADINLDLTRSKETSRAIAL